MNRQHYKIYNTADALPESWNALPHQDLFLKTTFLKALECSCPKNITPYYIGVFNQDALNNELVGIAIIQRVEMYLEDVFRNNNDKCLKQKTKRLVSKFARGNALVVGNLMHTGQHGLFFNTEKIKYPDYLETLSKAVDTLKTEIKQKHKKKIRIIAFKDYFEDDEIHNNIAFFKKEKLYKVQVQPNMVFNVSNDWKTQEDYISAFKKKYRDRYKSAIKKGKPIIKRELSFEEIKRFQNELFQLYKNVSDNARVNSFILCEDHFSSLKQELKEDFKVIGYFINEELVGFFTLIVNNKILETYFLGYNKEHQRQHQMYINMLFDMAKYGIENKFTSIIYARTAMEIKSSIGAKPRAMHIYMKHTNSFPLNALLKYIVKYLNPTINWEERHPFK